jgi:SAM-dependent methyltransferase
MEHLLLNSGRGGQAALRGEWSDRVFNRIKNALFAQRISVRNEAVTSSTVSQAEPHSRHVESKDVDYVASDGLPVPPLDMIFLVTGTREPVRFVEGAKARSHQGMVDALTSNGLDLNGFEAILDFGCGCGRIIRHWKYLSKPRLYGTDYNPALIEWCQNNLPFAEFKVNRLEPPLDYSDGQFDFVFCGSVFTHFSETLQFAWLRELRRVLRPRGYLMITTHGEYYATHLPEDLRQRFQDGFHVVIHEENAGQNACGAYHSEKYIRHTLTTDYELVDFIPQGWHTQDLVLLRKRL